MLYYLCCMKGHAPLAPQRIRLSVGVEPVSQLSVRAFDRGGFCGVAGDRAACLSLAVRRFRIAVYPFRALVGGIAALSCRGFCAGGDRKAVGRGFGGVLCVFRRAVGKNQFRKTGKICGGIGFSGRFCVFRRDCRGLNDLFPSSFPLRFFF